MLTGSLRVDIRPGSVPERSYFFEICRPLASGNKGPEHPQAAEASRSVEAP